VVVENPLRGQETEIEEDACSVGYCCVFFSEAVLEARRGYIFSCVVVVVRGS
jgi:hypothetical protein